MKMDLNREDNFSELRKKAEENLARTEKKSSETDHELDIHKEELEMQAEELFFTQKKLIKSLAEYAQLFNLAPIGYIVMDQYGKVLNLNKAATDLLGLGSPKIIGKHFSVFLNGQAWQDDYYRHRNEVLETEKQKKVENELRRPDGKTIPVLIESSVINDEKNNFKHLLSVIMDISEQKSYERNMEKALSKEKELNDLKSRFISTASHEFRTPLSAIVTSVDIIDRYLTDTARKKCDKHINRIHSSVSNLTEILNELLSLEKLENGDVKWEKKVCDIQKITFFAIEQMKPLLKNDQSIDYTHQGCFEFKTDKEIVQRILLNLLSNASKYSDEGKKIELRVKINDNSMEILVKDQGIGIPSEEQGKIFSRLFRAKNAEMISGAGLGLNILKKYVELLNGQISFVSEENKGTAFTVLIPE